MHANDESFMSSDRIGLAKRSADLWPLLRDNPRHSYYGPLVALTGAKMPQISCLQWQSCRCSLAYLDPLEPAM
jgi:hypothetical protein